ncbi:MAG: phosphatidate cytidylyltransferase [Dehalococcoidia bacterium]
MLIQRLAVAAVGLPLLGLLVWLPEQPFAIIVALILGAAAFEMVRALVPDRPLSVPLSAGVATAFYVAITRQGFELTEWSFIAVTVIALALILRPNARLANSLGGWWVTAVLYVGVFGSHLVLLRLEPEGQRWLIVLLAATFATDTGAYAVGRLFGRHLFMPRISPKKTWEGALGGLVFGAAAGIATAYALDLRLEGAAWAAWFLALPPAAIAGDLLESALKRKMEVKDMSHLLPGHGGLLDRLDSILVVGVCLYWIVRWLQV